MERPFGALTAQDRFPVIEGDRIRMLSINGCRFGLGFLASYPFPGCPRLTAFLLRNAVGPTVAEDVLTALPRRL